MSASDLPPHPQSTITNSTHMQHSNHNTQGATSLSELEKEVLEEYRKVLENLNKLSPLLSSLSTTPTAAVLDGLRLLERKTSLVSTLLKASVYSIVLQQEMLEGEGE